HLAGQRPSDDFLDLPGNGNQRLEINARVEARFLKQIDEVLGADVAGGARRERASAEARDRRFVFAYAEIEAEHDVGEADATRVVEVQRDPLVGKTLADGLHEARDGWRRRHAGRVAQRQAVDAELRVAVDEWQDRIDRAFAFERATERAGDGAAQRRLATCDGSNLRRVGERARDRRIEIGLVLRLARRDKA